MISENCKITSLASDDLKFENIYQQKNNKFLTFCADFCLPFNY